LNSVSVKGSASGQEACLSSNSSGGTNVGTIF
jgi:hypothetical protein